MAEVVVGREAEATLRAVIRGCGSAYYNFHMKLYVCWGTFPVPWPRKEHTWRPEGHPCKQAHDALRHAGHSPDVVRVYGFGQLPDVTPGRKEVRRLTGESWVPVLVLDGGEVIKGSKNIVAWARDNQASGAGGA